MSDYDDNEDDDPTESRLFERAEIAARKALARCGIAEGTGLWEDEMTAITRALYEQRPDLLARREPLERRRYPVQP